MEAVAKRVKQRIGEAAELYHRLVILAAPAGAGKTAVLREIHARTAAPLMNVNLELSRCMLDLTECRRALRLPDLVSDITGATRADPVLLDNIEILFDVSLKQDPLRLLQGLSRNRIVVATWSGEIRTEGRRPGTGTSEDGRPIPGNAPSTLYLVYAKPHHPEYRRYPVGDFLVVNPEVTT